MSTAPDDDAPFAPAAPARVVPRKLSLRVSGARPGSSARPASASETVATVPATRPLGLRVHTSTLAPRPAAVASVEPYDYE